MKVKINMVSHPNGNAIQMDPNHRWRIFGNGACSSPLNTPKYIEWVSDGSANISIHHDFAMNLPVDKTKKNYGWILESTTIVEGLINQIVNSLDIYKSKFEFIFTHDRRICEIDSNFFKFTIPPPLSYIRNKSIYNKTKDISVIMSNANDRPPYVYRINCLEILQDKSNKFNKLEKIFDFDVYGRGRGGMELPWVFDNNGELESGKLIGLKDYRFSFAFDNNNYNTIFSDKLTDCFATGTIPIWHGCSDIGDWFDKDGIIFWEENIDLLSLTKELYHSKINSIKNNFDIISNMISAEDYIYENYLK